jgi:hypothetical protein
MQAHRHKYAVRAEQGDCEKKLAFGANRAYLPNKDLSLICQGTHTHTHTRARTHTHTHTLYILITPFPRPSPIGPRSLYPAQVHYGPETFRCRPCLSIPPADTPILTHTITRTFTHIAKEFSYFVCIAFMCEQMRSKRK